MGKRNRTWLFRSGVFLTILLTCFVLQPGNAADPGDEEANQQSCTGTCSTCPGKANALVNLAREAKLLLTVKGLSTSDEAQLIRSTLAKSEGVAACVAFAQQSWVWVAYDTETTDLTALSNILKDLGFAVTGELQSIEALSAPVKGTERAAIYVLLPADHAGPEMLMQTATDIAGVSVLRYDLAYNLLLVDFNPVQTTPEKLKLALVHAGFAAGLPGEELTQPK